MLGICRFRVVGALLVAVIAAGSAVASGADSDKSLVVGTGAGQIRGVARAGGSAEFLGIPYAQPPVR